MKPQHLSLLLHEAVQTNKPDFIEHIIRAGADVKATAGPHYDSPLLVASRAENIEMLELIQREDLVEEELSSFPQTKARKTAHTARKAVSQSTSEGNEEPKEDIPSESDTEVNSKAKTFYDRWNEIDPYMMYEFESKSMDNLY
jgi:hypothetical protein